MEIESNHQEVDESANGENEFLNGEFEMESCCYCGRTFFKGKLAFHLKLCTREHPMMKKSSKTKLQYSKKSFSSMTHYIRCENCHARIPEFLLEKHNQFCNETSLLKFSASRKPSSTPKPREQDKEKSLFPKIKEVCSISHMENSKKIKIKCYNENLNIKIRDELRCLRKAEEVQKIECEHCRRRFSEKAAQRHIPICCILKEKEAKDIVYFKESKNRKEGKKIEILSRSYEVSNNKIYKSLKLISNSILVEKKLPSAEESGGKNNPESVGNFVENGNAGDKNNGEAIV